MNGYNIYNPDSGSAVGQFVMNNFSNPVEFICGAIGAVENTTAPETAKLCSQYLGPALRLINFNYLPFPISPYLMPSASPEQLEYSEPGLEPGGSGGSPVAPEIPPSISAYNPGPEPPPPFTGREPGVPPPGPSSCCRVASSTRPTCRTRCRTCSIRLPGNPGRLRVQRPVHWPPKPRRPELRHQQKGRHQHDQGKPVRLAIAVGSCVALTASGCAFQGVNSLPLPGAVGRGADSSVYHVEIANVATLEPNSPVMMNDVVVGSVRSLSVRDWHADVEFSVQPDVVVPANAVASVGQTSLLGSMHLALNPPAGQAPNGKLPPGATIQLNNSSTYPTTEQTLSSLAAVVNGGGLGQMGDIIHNFSAAINGRETDFRDLLTRLDTFVGALDAQRDNIVASDRGPEPPGVDLRRATRRHHPRAGEDSAGARRTDQGAAEIHHRTAEAGHLQRDRQPVRQRFAGRSRQEPEKPGARAEGVGQHRAGPRPRCSSMPRISRSPRASWTG